MFTGLIEEVGVLKQFNKTSATQAEIVIDCKEIQGDVKLGDSVAVDGICLTVVKFDEHQIVMELSSETVKKSLFGEKVPGTKLNLERAMRVGDRLGGHIVQGHVEGLAQLKRSEKEGDFYTLEFSLPGELAQYFVAKGSVCVNGISLTIAELTDDSFSIAVIPHTYQWTNLSSLQKGSSVHIETDVLARYVERMLMFKRDDKKGEPNLDMDFLANAGF